MIFMATIASKGVGLIEGKPFSQSVTSADVAATLKVAPARMVDALAIVDIIAEAFADDPTWSWAFPNPTIRKRWWEFCVNGALRYPWVLKTEGYEVVSVWIPPSGNEFSDDDIQRVPNFLQESVGARAPEVTELLSRFDKAHPRGEPHYYLSLLATADGHRGRGLGMALLSENLARIDLAGMPAYLESSNPLNNHRYEAVGFRTVARFQAPGNGPIVTGMWREHR
jgi:GNAT superfamily N-acetyltransferase